MDHPLTCQYIHAGKKWLPSPDFAARHPQHSVKAGANGRIGAPWNDNGVPDQQDHTDDESSAREASGLPAAGYY